MPVLVNKTFLVDTDDVDEAYELTKINNEKVAVYSVGQVRPMNTQPAAAQPPGTLNMRTGVKTTQ